ERDDEWNDHVREPDDPSTNGSSSGPRLSMLRYAASVARLVRTKDDSGSHPGNWNHACICFLSMTTSVQTPTSFAYDNRYLAETYDRLSDMQFEAGKQLVRHFGDLDGARVLDVGCGTGRLARWMVELVGPGGSVVGIDPLAERISIARAHASGIQFDV